MKNPRHYSGADLGLCYSNTMDSIEHTFVYWDARESTKLASTAYSELLNALDDAATRAQELARKLRCQLVHNIGDGQVYEAEDKETARLFAQSLREHLGTIELFKVAIVIGQGNLEQRVIGAQSPFFWQCKTITDAHRSSLGTIVIDTLTDE